MTGPQIVPVLVARVDAGPAAVPSRVVLCGVCHADCWLSQRTGGSTMALAASMGTPLILCFGCAENVAAAIAAMGGGS